MVSLGLVGIRVGLELFGIWLGSFELRVSWDMDRISWVKVSWDMDRISWVKVSWDMVRISWLMLVRI